MLVQEYKYIHIYEQDIDCEQDDEVYNAICRKYEDDFGLPISKKCSFLVYK